MKGGREMDLTAKVRKTAQKYAMLSHGDAVLVAVSGGPDSMALLRLLCRIKEEMELRLEVAHLQHGIRGEEACSDALFVKAVAEQLGLHPRASSIATKAPNNPCGSTPSATSRISIRRACVAIGRRGLFERRTG